MFGKYSASRLGGDGFKLGQEEIIPEKVWDNKGYDDGYDSDRIVSNIMELIRDGATIRWERA